MSQQTGPACGNNPNYRMSDDDRRVVEDFKAYLVARRELRDRIAAAIWERQNPGRQWADCEYRWRADAEEDADAVLSVLPAPVDRAALVRACASFVRDTYSGEWADDAAATLERDADKIERGEPCSLLRLAAVLPATANHGTGTGAELTAEEARALAEDLGLQLYLAQDALAFVSECCTIAEREQRPITTTDVREWLKGARCGRQLAADAGLRRVADEPAATAIRAAALREAADFVGNDDECDCGGCDTCVPRSLAAELRRMAGETQPAEAQPERCEHCGQPIRRVTGTLAAWWVHDPGGNTVCDWARPASSPRATPKPATEAEPLCCPLCADKPLLRTPTEAHDHFRTMHPEQQLAGPGPWPLLVPPPSCPGYETVPNRCPCPCEGCKHHCGAHQPAAAARQDGADRPGLRERYRAAWAALTPEQQATRLAEFEQDDEPEDGAQPS